MQTGILSGIRVIDCGTYIAAPAAATVMSDFGAEVIKIERPPYGDPYRFLSLSSGMPVSDLLYCWILDGRNKKSLALDLGQSEGREALMKLVKTADVFVTNYPPPLVRKFRLSYEELSARHPKLIYAHITGYGEAGDHADRPGYDLTAYWARSGLMSTMHNADAEPCGSPAGFGDHPTAMALFGGIMLALYNRQRTGAGMKVSTSLMANGAWSHSCTIQAAMCGATFLPRSSRKTAYNPLVNHYVSRDSKRFIVCCLDPAKDWPALCKALQLGDLAADERLSTPEGRRENRAYVIERIDRAVAQCDMAQLAELFITHDIIWGPVPSVLEVTRDPQMEANGVFAELEHPERGTLRTVSNPLNLQGFPKAKPVLAPEVGEQTREVLAEAGYSPEEIEALIAKGIAYCSDKTRAQGVSEEPR